MTTDFLEVSQQQPVRFKYIRFPDYTIEREAYDTGYSTEHYDLICGVGEPLKSSVETISKNDLLLSMLVLAEKMLSKYKKTEGNYMPYATLHDEDVETVLEWCRRYGLPLCDDETTDGDGHVCVSGFLERLSIVYSLFQLWSRIEYDDTDPDNPYTNESVDRCKYLLQVCHSSEAFLTIDYSGQAPILCFFCRSVYELALTQLMFQITSKENGSIYKCEECHSFFVRYHAGRTLCDRCRPLRYKRSRRIKEERLKQEASSNASKE